MDVQPFVVLGAAQRESIVHALGLNLQQWAEKWLICTAGSETKTQLSETHDQLELQSVSGMKFMHSDGRDWGVCSASEAVVYQMGMRLLGSSDRNTDERDRSSLLRSVVRDALGELIQVWLGHAGDSIGITIEDQSVEELIPTEAMRPGCGVFGVSATIDECEVHCWLPIDVLATRVNLRSSKTQVERAKIVDMASALESQKVKLRAMLGDLELSLASLSHLRPGDVVRLDKSITAPLSLEINASRVGFSGFLGRQSSNLAFRVDGALP